MKTLSIDNSALQSYRDCPRLFWLNHVQEYKPQAENVALLIGREVHEELDKHYKDEGYVSNHPIVNQYQANYPRQFDSYWPPVATERHLSHDLGLIQGVSVTYTGTIDLVANKRIIDHKTGGNIWYHKSSYGLEHQMSGYRFLWAKTQGEVFDHYEINSIGTKPDKSGRYPFDRNTFNFTRSVDEIEAELRTWIEKLILDFQSNRLDSSPNYGHCQKYNGCTFLNVCKALTSESKADNLSMSFKQESWKGFSFTS